MAQHYSNWLLTLQTLFKVEMRCNFCQLRRSYEAWENQPLQGEPVDDRVRHLRTTFQQRPGMVIRQIWNFLFTSVCLCLFNVLNERMYVLILETNVIPGITWCKLRIFYQCMCKWPYLKTFKQLAKHKRTHLNPEERKDYRCSYCGIMFDTIKLRQRHEERHQVWPLSCIEPWWILSGAN